MSTETKDPKNIAFEEGRHVIKYTVAGCPDPVVPPVALEETIAFTAHSLAGVSAMEKAVYVPTDAIVVSRTPRPSIPTASLTNISGATPENVFDAKVFFVNRICKSPELYGELVESFRAKGVELCDPHTHPHDKLMLVENSLSNDELYALLCKHMQ